MGKFSLCLICLCLSPSLFVSLCATHSRSPLRVVSPCVLRAHSALHVYSLLHACLLLCAHCCTSTRSLLLSLSLPCLLSLLYACAFSRFISACHSALLSLSVSAPLSCSLSSCLSQSGLSHLLCLSLCLSVPTVPPLLPLFFSLCLPPTLPRLVLPLSCSSSVSVFSMCASVHAGLGSPHGIYMYFFVFLRCFKVI